MKRDAALAEEAALWIVRLSAPDPAEREAARRGLDAWRRQSPEHAAAADGMQAMIGQVQGLGRPVKAGVNAALGHARSRRFKRLALSLAAALLVGGAGWGVLQAYPVPYLLADMRSATGHWDERTLPDGTRISLGSGSAVNVRYDATRRVLQLVQGEILVAVAKDAQRPFVVETPQGRMTALGTRFVVDSRPGYTDLTMIESSVAVEPLKGARAVVTAGEQVRIRQAGIERLSSVEPAEVDDAWRRHQMVVRNRPLAEILDELNRHRPGRLFYDRQALQAIRMAVVLPLDDTDRALELLVESVPGLTLHRVTPYLVWVSLSR